MSKIAVHKQENFICGVAVMAVGDSIVIDWSGTVPDMRCTKCGIIVPADSRQIALVERVEVLEEIGLQLLFALGESPQRDGLVETPNRWARAWTEFVEYNAGDTNKLFDVLHGGNMAVIGPLKVWSVCEHHLLPFYVDLYIGYIPADSDKRHEAGWAKVLGLSKFGRIAQRVAHRLQIQERLVLQVAEEVRDVTKSNDIAVFGIGEHLCMTTRGAQMATKLRTSVLLGAFEAPQVRAEFMALIQDAARG